MGGPTSTKKVCDGCYRVHLRGGYGTSPVEGSGAGGGKGWGLEGVITENALVYDVVALAESFSLV
jgi:hypothetical protein